MIGLVVEIEAIVLAKGAPNRCQDGRTVMCAIVVSKAVGLIRIYPLSITNHFDLTIWSTAVFDVDFSKTDQRSESRKLISCQVTGEIKDAHEKRSLLDACVLRSGEVDPIDYQNFKRKSIAIVKCSGKVGASLLPRESSSNICVGTDEDGFAMTQSEFPFKPYIEWSSIQGKNHRTHLVGQEVYMGMMRNASTPFRIFENIHIGDADYEHWLVLGNTKDRRNIWVAAHVHRQKKIAQQSMLTSFETFDGTESAWPYETQGAANAKRAADQMEFNFTT